MKFFTGSTGRHSLYNDSPVVTFPPYRPTSKTTSADGSKSHLLVYKQVYASYLLLCCFYGKIVQVGIHFDTFLTKGKTKMRDNLAIKNNLILTPKELELLNNLVGASFEVFWENKRTHRASTSPAALREWIDGYDVLATLSAKLHRHYGTHKPCRFERDAQRATAHDIEGDNNV